jgi:hypothetical protein
MQFRELTDDKQWDLIRSSLPSPAYTGRPRADDRMTLKGLVRVDVGMQIVHGYDAIQVWLLQNSVGAAQEEME